MADSVYPADIGTFIDNAVWAIHSTYHTVLKASPGAAIFGRDMLFDILFVADWNKTGDYRQSQTDRSNNRENNKCVDHDYKVGDKVIIRKDGIDDLAVYDKCTTDRPQGKCTIMSSLI